MFVRDYYADKVILITGCTGFLGKVVLEKILRSLPNIKKIYLLIRPKSGVSVMERIKREIFQSQCFDLVRQAQQGNFLAFIDQLIDPVEGDIADPQIIFDPIKKQEIIENVHIIINNAASIDFNLRLDQALQINYHGPLGLLGLSKQCKKLEIFTHVSTAYVNSEKTGFIDEQIYSYPNDPEEIVAKISSMPTEQILANTHQLIAPWANTYTFTKNLSERALQKLRGNIPICIVRPAIIISSYQEPFPGWIDSMAAAGTLTLMVASGVTKFLIGNNFGRADLVPVDLVSNSIIVGTAFQAKKNSLSIFHSNTSHVNPITWYKYSVYVLNYSKTNPFEQQFSQPRFTIVPDQKTYDVFSSIFHNLIQRKFYLEYELPSKIMTRAANLTGSQEMKKNAQRFEKIKNRVALVEKLFSYFIANDWCFESKKAVEITEQLSKEERLVFNVNPRIIDWKILTSLNLYGMQKYVFRMDVSLPFHEQNKLLSRLNIRYLEDTQKFIQKTSKIRQQNLSKIFDRVLYSERVQNEIRNQSNYSQNQDSVVAQNNYQDLLKYSKEFLNGLDAQIDPKSIQTIYLVFHSMFKRIFDQIVINDHELKQIKQLIQKPQHSVVLIPSFKSYIDLVLLQYIHIIYELDLSFISGLKEWADITLITSLLKKCGGFFIDANKLSNPLCNIILEEYLAAIMKKKHIIGYQIERKRERSGKTVRPYQFIFDHLIEGYMRNQEEIGDVILVPMTINYDKIYEGQQFPYELLGDESKRESLFKMFRNLLWTTEKYGRIHVQYGKPISLKERIGDFMGQRSIDTRIIFSKTDLIQPPQKLQEINQHKKDFIEHLSLDLCYTLSDNLVIMSTSLVASMLLMRRQGGIKEEDLLDKVVWLYKEIIARNGTTSLNVQPSQATIRNALKYLENFVDMKKDVFSPYVKANLDYKNILMLAYYRNNLIHLFINEAYIATSLQAFGDQISQTQGILLKRLWDQAEFLSDILRDEFVVRDQISTYDQFLNTLKIMKRRKFLNIEMFNGQEIVKITDIGKNAIQFLSSLLLPFVETYWVALALIKQLPQGEIHTFEMLESKIQSLADTMYNEGFLVYYESCSLESIGNSIQRYSALKVMQKKDIGNKSDISSKSKSELGYILSSDKLDSGDTIQSLYERLTFFKPIVTFNTGLMNVEEDIRRILQTKVKQQAAKL